MELCITVQIITPLGINLCLHVSQLLAIPILETNNFGENLTLTFLGYSKHFAVRRSYCLDK